MPPPRQSRCQICESQSSKYSCPSCLIPYCSVSCYKEHRSTSCATVGPATEPEKRPALPRASPERQSEEFAVPDAEPLRPLTSLKWPYIPEESAFPDPLKRDDPKPLQLHHYESIATSADIRSVLGSNPTLPALLRRLDKLRGPEREEALEALLGVANSASAQRASTRRRVVTESENDQKALKGLAEAVEKAVRGEKAGVLGLDWAEVGGQ